MITALLPLDGPSRDNGRVALAFLAYTAVRPAAAAGLHDDTAERALGALDAHLDLLFPA
ncbi:hypothetical protein GCM10020358_33460 [Amorphoplanes nipponensis]|uniref:Uncharacterized protein n=1 Tax=Actinoplanes nipponensis TaxID=135950 RepID=A0A919JI01_9ACTN|nr:hypothetical protein [Actinoplanes nipponensis]GIE51389.1 hypothetical protein Ani05nite_49230 [Actinoplanes nipponensis]